MSSRLLYGSCVCKRTVARPVCERTCRFRPSAEQQRKAVYPVQLLGLCWVFQIMYDSRLMQLYVSGARCSNSLSQQPSVCVENEHVEATPLCVTVC